MDGSLDAESSGVPGQGSTFRLVIRVPVAETEQAEPAPDVSALAGRRVLVVDDNPASLRILAGQLERIGLAVTATGSAIGARDLANDRRRPTSLPSSPTCECPTWTALGWPQRSVRPA